MSDCITHIESVLTELRANVEGADNLTVEIERERAVSKLHGKVSRPAKIVDAALQQIRPQRASDATKERLAFEDPEPWPDEVVGTQLLEDLETSFRRYLTLPQGAPVVLALWVVHAHALKAFQITPRVAITSAVKECGKITLLDVLETLVPRPLQAASVTASVVFRTVEKYGPTLLVDEAETFLSDRQELRGVLNAGHRRGGQVLRNVPVGDDYDPRAFSVFSPAAIAKIGRMPETLEDRSFVIKMRRRTASEMLKNFRRDRVEHLHKLKRQASRWATDNLERLRSSDPQVPEGVFNCEADNWRSLLVIADAAGGDWPQRARQALAQISQRQSDDDSSVKIQLLIDIQSVFQKKGLNRLFTQDILDELTQMEDRPWPEWRRGNRLSSRQLAKLLGEFDIRPKQLRIEGISKKGYDRSWFEDAWSRYLPPEPKQAKQLNNYGASPETPSRNIDEPRFASRSGEKSIATGIVSDVSLREQGMDETRPDEWGEL